MANMTGRKTTLVRELADVCASRYRDARKARMTPAERATDKARLAELETIKRSAFEDRCAWCGIPERRLQRDHFPPLVVGRMWTGFVDDLCVPSCSNDNRQYVDWAAHLDVCWRSPSLELKAQHSSALAVLLRAQTPVPQELFRQAFDELRGEFDQALETADRRIAELAGNWLEGHLDG